MLEERVLEVGQGRAEGPLGASSVVQVHKEVFTYGVVAQVESCQS